MTAAHLVAVGAGNVDRPAALVALAVVLVATVVAVWREATRERRARNAYARAARRLARTANAAELDTNGRPRIVETRDRRGRSTWTARVR